ncbi:MAG: 2-oxo acid dehydrogenase subunit E2, partial [Dethiosulfatibacter sp.]|nr:2-oxo acid dehydrogenase subunit E2 [Dethiosulfatibacter sp.]
LEKVKKTMPKAVNLTGIRKISANKLTSIWQNVTMVTLTVEVDVSKIIELCNRLNSISESRSNQINMTDVLIKIMGMALVEHPKANVSLIDGMLIEHQDINISVAVALDEGLIVPVIKRVDQKGLLEINGEKRRLIEKAKNGSLNKDELTGGCMTISNIGMLGADIFTPILNSPESHILGLGRVNKKPVVVEDEIVIRPMMWLSHTFDHRALDGVPAMKLLASIRDMIEEPYKIIL